jgi:hypothetical protein
VCRPMSGASSASRRIRLTSVFEIFCGVADLANGTVDAVVEHPLPAPSPDERFDQRAIRLRFRGRRDLAAVRRHDALTTASALEAHRDAHDEDAARVVARRTGQKFNCIANQRRRSLGCGSWPSISFRRDSSSRVE